MIKNPVMGIKLFEDKANKIIDELDSNLATEKKLNSTRSCFPTPEKRLRLNFEGNVGRNFVTPRGLNSSMLNSLVRVQGIVTRMSIVKPKLMKSYHYVPATGQGYIQNYKDQYSIEGQGENMSKMFATQDNGGNILSPEYGY